MTKAFIIIGVEHDGAIHMYGSDELNQLDIAITGGSIDDVRFTIAELKAQMLNMKNISMHTSSWYAALHYLLADWDIDPKEMERKELNSGD